MLDKAELRERGKAARAALGAQTRAEFDARIVAACRDNLDWDSYRRVMVFLPIAKQHEPNLWPLVRWLWAAHPDLELYVPRVSGKQLEVALIEPVSVLKENTWGILEPVGEFVLPPGDKIDVVLVPLLGFDDTGHRVGYGHGYYDWFLAGHTAVRCIGVGYECLHAEDEIAAEAHDERLQEVVTEEGFKRVGVDQA